MPDLRVLVQRENLTVVEIPRYNDSVSGIEQLAQTAALMIMDPNYGNLARISKKRVKNNEVQEIVLTAVDIVEQAMIAEQGKKIIPDDEILESLDVERIDILKDSVDIYLKVINSLNNQAIVNI
jgi:hypothetical protein